MDLLLDRYFLQFVQRLAVIAMVGWFLWGHPESTTAWAVVSAVTADLFHASKNGNGNGIGAGK